MSVRGLVNIPRLHFLRLIAPRPTSPVLPVTRFRLTPRVTRPLHLRPFSSFRPSRPLTAPSPSTPDAERPTLPPNPTLSQRLKFLIKSYGWYALGVYFVLSALDFGVAFIGVNLLGAEYVSHAAATVKSAVYGFIHSRPSEPGREDMDSLHNAPAGGGSEGLYAMLVLAYTIHKTLFLPVRVGLTAAFTPKFVNWLARRGWAGSAGTKRAAQEMRDKLNERRRRSLDD